MLKKIGYFLSSTNKKRLKKDDYISSQKQLILGYSLLIPFLVAFFGGSHLFSLYFPNNRIIVLLTSFIYALIIIFFDFALIFGLSFNSNSSNRKIVIIRFILAVIIGFVVAVTTSISINKSYIFETSKKEFTKKQEDIINKLENRIIHLDNLINLRKQDYQPTSSLQFEKSDIQEEILSIKNDILNYKMNDDFIVMVSFTINEIFVNHNKKMTSIVLSLLAFLLLLDLIPLILKFALPRSKYELQYKSYIYEKRIKTSNDTILDKIYDYYKKALSEIFNDNENSIENTFVPKKDEYLDIINDFKNIFKIDDLSFPSILEQNIISDENIDNHNPDTKGFISKLNNSLKTEKAKGFIYSILLLIPVFVISNILSHYAEGLFRMIVNTLAFIPITNAIVMLLLPEDLLTDKK